MMRRAFTSIAFLVFFVGCSDDVRMLPPTETRFPVGTTVVRLATADHLVGGPCSVSVDGQIAYALPAGSFPPIDFTTVQCAAPTRIDPGVVPPPRPQWSIPRAPTQTRFLATSLQEQYIPRGITALDALAARAGFPISWMIGNDSYIANDAAFYNAAHARRGDDVELEDASSLYDGARRSFPWFAPAVAVEGAGSERKIALARSLGNSAFWGITWNSHLTDRTDDLGAPWGVYCADPTSYKRPEPDGGCSLLAVEWTARDLTRSVLSDTNGDGYSAEAAFSTDPDDIRLRAGFTTQAGAEYARRLVDAYAAAGETQPLVMVSQQETSEQAVYGELGDNQIMGALYDQAHEDGLIPTTLRALAVSDRTAFAQPRAIAFPFIPGGRRSAYGPVPYQPATIDYHDRAAGMTFVSGHTMPLRYFDYAAATSSVYDRPLAQLDGGAIDLPKLTSVNVHFGTMTFAFSTPVPRHFAVAVWTNPRDLGVVDAHVTPAGRAGFVAAFDLPAGVSTQTIRCGSCRTTTFPYAL